MKIYVASSWRNEHQPAVVTALRDTRHEVYDFRNPEPGNTGFRWSDVEPEWKTWSPERFRALLQHVAESGFRLDMDALESCDACVMLLPCGRSASLEMGYAIGAGKRTFILLADGEPELMFKMADHICLDVEEVVGILAAGSGVAPTVCSRCGGYGQVADTDDEEPWTAWADLPPGSDLAVRLGVVKPKPCPSCAAPEAQHA